METAQTRSQPIKVLHLLNVLDIGGMEAGVLNIVNGIPRDRIAGGICSFRPATAFRSRMAPGVPLFEFRRRDGNDPVLVMQLCRLFRRQRPDVVHTHSWGTLCEGIVAARLAGVPRIVHGEHGTLETRPRNVRVQRFMWPRAQRILSVSDRLADRMSAIVGYPRERIQTILNGVDLDRLASGRRADTRKALGVSDDTLLFLAVGRLVPVKDHATMLESFRLAASALGSRCALLIAGDGPLRDDLEAQRVRLGLERSVTLLGARRDIPDLLAACDVFVLSSLSEGLSNTVLEAMAAGRPVIATRVGGNDELVRDGVTGLLVPPASSQDLSAAMVRLGADRGLLAATAAAASDNARRFALDTMLQQYETMYREVVAAPARPASRVALDARPL